MFKHVRQKKEEEEKGGYSLILTKEYLLIQMFAKGVAIVGCNQTVWPLFQLIPNLVKKGLLINPLVTKTSLVSKVFAHHLLLLKAQN